MSMSGGDRSLVGQKSWRRMSYVTFARTWLRCVCEAHTSAIRRAAAVRPGLRGATQFSVQLDLRASHNLIWYCTHLLEQI